MESAIVIALLIAWFFNLKLFRIPTIEATCFFVLGSYLALKPGLPFFVDRMGGWLFFLTVILVPLDAYLQLNGICMPVHKLTIITCSGAILAGTGLVVKRRAISAWLISMAASSFFVYAAHDFLLGVIIKLSYKMAAPVEGMTMLFLYILNPLFVVFICLMVYRVLLRLCPRSLNLITGGR